jgi:hypothetical protein
MACSHESKPDFYLKLKRALICAFFVIKATGPRFFKSTKKVYLDMRIKATGEDLSAPQF